MFRINCKWHIIYNLFLFVSGSIGGWCLEVVFRSICHGHLVIPGFLIGPYCPIYGSAILSIRFLCNDRNNVSTFFRIFAITSLLEYIVSVIFESVFHVLLWDYSMLPLSVGTRVNFFFSLAWGLFGLFIIKKTEPCLKNFFYCNLKNACAFTTGGVLLIILDTAISMGDKL